MVELKTNEFAIYRDDKGTFILAPHTKLLEYFEEALARGDNKLVVRIVDGTPDINTDLLEALEELLFAARVHTFKPSETDHDTCAYCGSNFRDTSQHISRPAGDTRPFPTTREIRAEAEDKARAAIARARATQGGSDERA